MSGQWTDCPNCGVNFGMPGNYLQNRRDDKQLFYCPNGHSMSYKESTVERLQRERDMLKQETARLEDEKREAEQRAAAAEKKTEKLKKRIGSGNCPCCKRHFSNVARHMVTQHPEVGNANVVKLTKPRIAEKAS